MGHQSSVNGFLAKILKFAFFGRLPDYQLDRPQAKVMNPNPCVYLLILHAVLTMPSVPTSGQDDLLSEPAPTYMGREIAQTMHYLGAPWLTRESRDREEDCHTLLEALEIKPGETVCDMGCGNGFYAVRIAKLLGDSGKVIAVDIQREMLELLKERAAAERITNIDTVLGTIIDPKLPEASIDLMLLVDVYHEFSHPQEMLAAIRKSLKPDGRVALVEFRAEDPKVPIKPLHKMSKVQIMKEFPPNGFKLVEEFDELPWQHLMFFQRDDAEEQTRR
jgi:ubiquinone/menaquinone biosynthesis C-methylase UbiE